MFLIGRDLYVGFLNLAYVFDVEGLVLRFFVSAINSAIVKQRPRRAELARRDPNQKITLRSPPSIFLSNKDKSRRHKAH
jgi:hypothetical protein